MDSPSQHKFHPGGSLSSSQLGGPPCGVIYLAFGFISTNNLNTPTFLYFARSSQLSSSRSRQAGQSVREAAWTVHHNTDLTRLVPSPPASKGGPPCWVISLAFDLIACHISFYTLQSANKRPKEKKPSVTEGRHSDRQFFLMLHNGTFCNSGSRYMRMP
jgi:hypothetical protein